MSHDRTYENGITNSCYVRDILYVFGGSKYVNEKKITREKWENKYAPSYTACVRSTHGVKNVVLDIRIYTEI